MPVRNDGYFIGKRGVTVADEPVIYTTPTACPFCRSSKVVTASEKVDASTYWRCEVCGQVWNIGRNRGSSRFGYGGR